MFAVRHRLRSATLTRTLRTSIAASLVITDTPASGIRTACVKQIRRAVQRSGYGFRRAAGETTIGSRNALQNSWIRHGAVVCALLWLTACDTKSPNMDDFGLRPGIRGVVTDAATGRTVRDARVSVQRQSTQTDANGRYTLSNLEATTSLVTVTHPNYVPAERSVRIASFDTPADFSLQPK